MGYLRRISKSSWCWTTASLFATAESSVLQDMRDSRGIWRIRLKGDGKDIVRVVALLQMEVLGASLLMLQSVAYHFEDGKALHLLQAEAMEPVARLL
jgi:hypothetical protein